MIQVTKLDELLRDEQKNEFYKNSNIVFVGEDGVGKEYLAKEIHGLRKNKDQFVQIDLEVEPALQTKQVRLLVDQTPQSFLQNAKLHTFFFRRLDKLEQHLLLQLAEFLRRARFYLSEQKPNFLELGLLASVEDTEFNHSNKILDNILSEFFIFEVKIPSLRNRKDELIGIARKLTSVCCQKNKKNVLGFTTETENILANYDWPGNLNELQSVLEGACLLNNGGKLITPEVLPPRITVDTVNSRKSISFFDEKKNRTNQKCRNLTACCSYYS